MKKFAILVLYFSLIFVVGCETESNNQSISSKKYNKKIENVNYGSIPDSVLLLYQNYAGILAVREMMLDPKLYESSIEIPAEIKNLFFNSLCQVYNATYLSARNKVIDEYKIGVFPYPETKNFLIEVDTSYTWVKNLISNHNYSGNSNFDSLVSKYALVYYNYFNFTGFTGFAYHSENQLNLHPLFVTLQNIQGVKIVFPNSALGDGNNITAEVFNDYVQLVYTYGFGDCPSGCIYRHYWMVRVYYDGLVEFVYEWGDRIN